MDWFGYVLYGVGIAAVVVIGVMAMIVDWRRRR